MKATRTALQRQQIYVETRINAPIDRVWEATQQPDQHQRWDLRFGTISYLPRAEDEPQRFTYATTVVPGVTVAGTGESLGDRERPDGTRWSGLKFWAADRRSIIEAGAGVGAADAEVDELGAVAEGDLASRVDAVTADPVARRESRRAYRPSQSSNTSVCAANVGSSGPPSEYERRTSVIRRSGRSRRTSSP